MLVDIENDSVEVSIPITREEFIETWLYRLAGLAINGYLDPEAKLSDAEEIFRDMLGGMYRTLNEPNYRPDKHYLEMFDKLGRLGEMFAEADAQNFIPASECLDDVHVKTFKQLQTVLREHPEIRRDKPSPQRLMINAADWARHIRDLDRQADHTLDVADEFADEARIRQERLRELKMADFLKKLPG